MPRHANDVYIYAMHSSAETRESYKVPFNKKSLWLEARQPHIFDRFEFIATYLWYMADLFSIPYTFLDFYQNYMAFWPLTSSFSDERDNFDFLNNNRFPGKTIYV